MNKIPQFMVRYHNNKYNRIEADTNIDNDVKMDLLRRLSRIPYQYERGLITLDDAMMEIASIDR